MLRKVMVIILNKALLILAALALATAVGCSGGEVETIDDNPAGDDTPIETEALDSGDCEGKALDTIVQLNIEKNIGSIDLAYLSTLPSLEVVTVDGANPHYEGAKLSSGSAVWSSADSQLLYLPSGDRKLELDSRELISAFRENSTVKLYTEGAVLDLKYNLGGDTCYWFLSRIEYGGKYINFAEPLRVNGERGLYVYKTADALVICLRHKSWDRAFIFANGELYDYGSQYGDFSVGNEFAIDDGTSFYVGEDGKLRYTRIELALAGVDYDKLSGAIISREQLWKTEGRVELHGAQPSFHAESAKTVADWFAENDTTIDEWFYELESSYATLDLLFAANRRDSSPDYSVFNVNTSKYKRARSNVVNRVYTGYVVDYTFTSTLSSGKHGFVMRIPQLSVSTANATAFNKKLADRYFGDNAEYIVGYEKSTEDGQAVLNLSYTTYKYGDVTVISVHKVGGLLATGMSIDSYDVYYYDIKNDRELSADEFVRLITGEKLTLAMLLRKINALDFVTDVADTAYIISEAELMGIIPDSDGKFRVLYARYVLEGRKFGALLYSDGALTKTEYTQK